MTVLADLASGVYRGIAWHVQRMSDADFPVLTFQGDHGAHWVFKSVEIEGCSPAKVKHWIDAELTSVDLRNRRKHA